MEVPIEKLSLETFEPSMAQPPYLTTPRSLEACRINGVNPIELVEIPIDEFRKDFPNDPDAAQRRYERIDGARRRILSSVIQQWKYLKDTNWIPAVASKTNTKETIIQVKPEAHCQLLELQAERFRKIESNQMASLQRMLNMEIKHAMEQVEFRKILQKHEEIAASNDNSKKEKAMRREAAQKDQLENLRKKEEAEAVEVKRMQAIESENARIYLAEQAKRAKRDKKYREDLEASRQQQLAATRLKKDAILKEIENEIEQKKIMLAYRDQETQRRQNESKHSNSKDKEKKLKEQSDKLLKTKEDAYNAIEMRRQEMLERLAADEAKRKTLNDIREKKRNEHIEEENERMRQKLKYAKDCSLGNAEDKAIKTLAAIELKESIKQEGLRKVREAQEKRRSIKKLREDSYLIAAARRKKMDDYKMDKLSKHVQDKDDRCTAIKEGYFTLSKMRNTMKDIVNRATLCIKDEIHRLHHKAEASPDRVVATALNITDHVLFPELQTKFGMVNVLDKHALSLLDPIEQQPQRSDSPDPTADARAMTAPLHGSMSLNNIDSIRPGTSQRKEKKHDPHSRSTKGTLQLQVMTKDSLLSTLEVSKARYNSPPKPETRSPSAKGHKKPNNRSHTLAPLISPSSLSHHNNNNNSSSSSINVPKSEEKLTNDSVALNYGNHVAVDKNLMFEDDDEEIFPVYQFSLNSSASDNNSHTHSNHLNQQVASSHAYTPVAMKEGEFRREYSSDHPLAGGQGKYKKERAMGKKALNSDLAGPGRKDVNATIEKLTFESNERVVDPKKQLEHLKREQNEALLRVLEDEKYAEENRESTLKSIADADERAKFDLIFAEERKRASERIIRMSKEHETRVKEAVIRLSSLGKKVVSRL